LDGPVAQTQTAVVGNSFAESEGTKNELRNSTKLIMEEDSAIRKEGVREHCEFEFGYSVEHAPPLIAAVTCRSGLV